jgi:creatinine amidohydrolase/Fe(II)-dependent formamide hydrolase-like protein
MLDPTRHVLLRLHASLPSPLALLEHEMHLNALLLHELEAHAIDQVGWPGRGLDGPLYDLAAPPCDHRLAACTWREVETLVAQGCRTAILPLGSTEQHGDHLPLDTDTVVGDALAARLSAAVGDAVVCPTLPVGCASEHLGFPGTLHVRLPLPAIAGTIRALGRHAITRLPVSAHGGTSHLRAMLPALETGVGGRPHSPIDALMDVLRRRVRRRVRSRRPSRQEIETPSLRHSTRRACGRRWLPAWRRAAMPGRSSIPICANAPDGVVGDPRRPRRAACATCGPGPDSW